MKYYKFLYYNLILLWKRKKNELENAKINSILTITFFPYLNIMTIPLIIMAIFGRTSIDIPEVNKWTIVYVLVGLGIFNYFLLMYKGKANRIIKRFDNQSQKTKKTGIRLTIVYLIISIVTPLFIMFFTSPNS